MRFQSRCPSGPASAACAASRWTATRTRPETCCVAACASSQEPRQRVGRRKALPRLPQRVTCRSRRPFGQRLRCTEGGSGKQNRKNQARFLSTRLLQVPLASTESDHRPAALPGLPTRNTQAALLPHSRGPFRTPEPTPASVPAVAAQSPGAPRYEPGRYRNLAGIGMAAWTKGPAESWSWVQCPPWSSWLQLCPEAPTGSCAL